MKKLFTLVLFGVMLATSMTNISASTDVAESVSEEILEYSEFEEESYYLPVVRIEDNTLAFGEEIIVTSAKAGKVRKVYTVRLNEDGTLNSRTLKGEEILVKAVAMEVKVGTKVVSDGGSNNGGDSGVITLPDVEAPAPAPKPTPTPKPEAPKPEVKPQPKPTPAPAPKQPAQKPVAKPADKPVVDKAKDGSEVSNTPTKETKVDEVVKDKDENTNTEVVNDTTEGVQVNNLDIEAPVKTGAPSVFAMLLGLLLLLVVLYNVKKTYNKYQEGKNVR